MIAVLLLAASLAIPTDPEARKVYYGEVDGAQKPAYVIASKVFAKIPEYKKIKEKGLTKDNPEYFILLQKANAKFFDALTAAAKKAGRDVVVEKGTEDFTGKKVVDLTAKVIKSLN